MTKLYTDRLCVPYSKDDAQVMKTLGMVVKTALLQMIEIEQRTLAKEGAKPAKGSREVKVFLADNSHETTWDDGSVTCNDETKGVCCTGECPC